MKIGMYTMYLQHGSAEYDAKYYWKHLSEHFSKIPYYVATCPAFNAKYDSALDPDLQLQCLYCRSLTRMFIDGETIFKVGDDLC